MPFYGLGRKLKYSMANGALVSVAALVPPEHEVVIIDENIERIDFNRLRRFDVIGVTGMVVQAERMLEILRKLQELPAIVTVGGPWPPLVKQRSKVCATFALSAKPKKAGHCFSKHSPRICRSQRGTSKSKRQT
jgi:hypothetical protein